MSVCIKNNMYILIDDPNHKFAEECNSCTARETSPENVSFDKKNNNIDDGESCNPSFALTPKSEKTH